MRSIFIAMAIALASPAFASNKCAMFADVTERVCVRSFAIALDRDLNAPTSGKRQEEENKFAYFICQDAVKLMNRTCTPSLGRDISVSECEFLSNVIEGMMSGPCSIAGEPRLDEHFSILGRNQRKAICKNAMAQARPTTMRTCK